MNSDNARSLRAALYVHRLAIANPTGISRYVIELATALRRLDSVEVDLYSGRTRRAADSGEVPLHHLPWPRRTTHLAWTLLHQPRVDGALRNPDVVHVTLPVAAVPAKAPVVLTMHDLLPLKHPDWYPPVHRWLFERAVRYHADHDALVITPSDVVADDVEQLLGIDRARIFAIPEGVDGRFAGSVSAETVVAARRKYGAGDGPFLVTVGALTPRKNLGVVFAALAQLTRGRGGVPRLIVIGGKGSRAEATYRAAQEHGVTDLVSFAGRLDDDDVRALLSQATALVHPSRGEGFGLTTLEAMAAGTPCISSTAGSLPEVVGDAGLLVDPDDSEAWASAIQRVVDDGRLRARLEAAGRHRAAAFTWPAAAERTAVVYRRALQRRDQRT